MKIAIVSDTHGDIADLVLALRATKPDRFIHLGDYESDARAIARETKLPYDAVGGNCDGSRNPGKLLTIDGKKIFLTHGHLFGVKMNLTRLYYHALEMGADVVFFGHTHRPFLENSGGILFCNPGSASRPVFGEGTFALWEDGEVSFLHVKKA